MSDLRDFTGKNRRFTGTDSEQMSQGTTGQRVASGSADKGKIRFNSTTNLMEYYDGIDWKAIDAPPVVTGFTTDDVGGSAVTSATIDNEKTADSGILTIEVLGSLFDTTGASVSFIASAGNGETINAASITRNNANKLTVTVAANTFDVANGPYGIRVTNGSGLSANLEGAISADADAPTFTNAADTNFDIYDSVRGSVSIAAASLVVASNVVASSSAYAVQSGSLPSGLSLNGTTGVISGSTSAVGSDTVSTFTIRATSTEGGTADRQFTITLKAPAATTYTSTGSANFAVPTGVSSVNILMVAGGGGGSSGHGGGGGAGGLIYRPGFSVTPGATIPLSVGAGGPHSPGGGDAPGKTGQDTTFSNLTAKGGGGGHQDQDGNPGGSGAGGSCYRPDGQQDGGSGIQPGQSGESGNYGFGNSGGNGSYDGDPSHGAQGGSGGGAGGSGAQSGKNANAPAGGVGRAYSISGSSVHYAGGGGNGCHQNVTQSGAGGTGGGGGSFPDGAGHGHPNGPGTANRGGGGGGGSDGEGGNGGSGIIILSY